MKRVISLLCVFCLFFVSGCSLERKEKTNDISNQSNGMNSEKTNDISNQSNGMNSEKTNDISNQSNEMNSEKANGNMSNIKSIKKGIYYNYNKQSYLWFEDDQSLSYCPNVLGSSSIDYNYKWKDNKIIGTSDWGTLVIDVVDNKKLRMDGILYFYESSE